MTSVETEESGRHKISLNDFGEPITCDAIISSLEHSSSGRVARCIAIIDQPLVFSSPEDDADSDNAVDTAVLIFPPACLPKNLVDTVVHAFVTGEGSMSAPRSRCESSLGLFDIWLNCYRDSIFIDTGSFKH